MDYTDRMLEQAEKGKLGGTLSKSRPEGKPMPRPGGLLRMFEMGGKSDAPKPKSHAPRGMATEVKGDLGHYSQMEVHKAFPRPIKKAGPDVKNPLQFRKPAIANDSTERKVMWPRMSAHNDVYKGAGGSYVG